MKYDHKELREDEVFIWNTNKIDGFEEKFKSLKTIRMGKQAYDINGNKLHSSYCRPVFINKSELELLDKIMMTSMKEEFAKIKRL